MSPKTVIQNNCLSMAARALTYLAEHTRPPGGNDNYNSEHCHQVAGELRATEAAVLDLQRQLAAAAPQPAKDLQQEHRDFESEFPCPAGVVLIDGKYVASMLHSDREESTALATAYLQQVRWEAWKRCASRRTVEVGAHAHG